jgi:tetratricopeptide (TPR) repeat protein
MKTGRFGESIQSYEKALSFDRNFVASYVGIANDQIFMDRGDEARQTLGRLTAVARNVGERRQSLLWSAMSYVHEGATDRALAEVQKMAAIAEAGKDQAARAGDLQLMSNILLAAGRPDDALVRHREQLTTIDQADVPPEVKEGVRRNALFDEARIALLRKDLAQAKTTAAAYTEKVAVRKIAFEVRQAHELQGMLALEEKRWPDAVSELEQANPLDPRVQYLLAQALQGKGDATRARAALEKAANFNALGLNYAYVRRRAKDMLAKS